MRPGTANPGFSVWLRCVMFDLEIAAFTAIEMAETATAVIQTKLPSRKE